LGFINQLYFCILMGKFLFPMIELFVIIISAYVIICLIAYKIQERIIFKPEKLSADFEFKYEIPFEELFYDIEPGVKINALHFKVENPKGIVLYFHGNTRSIKGWAKYAYDFSCNDFDVIMVDYRGFGKSTGKRSEKSLKSDSQHIYQEICKKFPESKIIIYGRSMGSGFAAKLASTNNPKMLILDAPYYSFSQLTSRYLPFLPITFILRFTIRTDIYIRYVRCPIYIIHGTRDRLIPFKSSVRLAKLAPLNTRLIPIHGGHHNDLPSFKEYHLHLGEILQEKFDVIFDKY
jgi:uncharacterized protein